MIDFPRLLREHLGRLEFPSGFDSGNKKTQPPPVAVEKRQRITVIRDKRGEASLSGHV